MKCVNTMSNWDFDNTNNSILLEDFFSCTFILQESGDKKTLDSLKVLKFNGYEIFITSPHSRIVGYHFL